MKTFNFTDEEKQLIISYLFNHRMKNVNDYDSTRWERISKQRKRIKAEIKKLTNYVKGGKFTIPLWFNFDELTRGRLGIENGKLFHIPVEEKYVNEEITNLLRKLIKRNSKHVW